MSFMFSYRWQSFQKKRESITVLWVSPFCSFAQSCIFQMRTVVFVQKQCEHLHKKQVPVGNDCIILCYSHQWRKWTKATLLRVQFKMLARVLYKCATDIRTRLVLGNRCGFPLSDRNASPPLYMFGVCTSSRVL